MTRKTLELVERLAAVGFPLEEALSLRRIEMALHRWHELECGDGNDWASWAIERDETTGRPYRATYPHTGKSYRRSVPDREAGAQKRLAAIMARHPALVSYIQGDCRGCALYIVRRSDLGDRPLDSAYTCGIAVCD